MDADVIRKYSRELSIEALKLYNCLQKYWHNSFKLSSHSPDIPTFLLPPFSEAQISLSILWLGGGGDGGLGADSELIINNWIQEHYRLECNMEEYKLLRIGPFIKSKWEKIAYEYDMKS